MPISDEPNAKVIKWMSLENSNKIVVAPRNDVSKFMPIFIMCL